MDVGAAGGVVQSIRDQCDRALSITHIQSLNQEENVSEFASNNIYTVLHSILLESYLESGFCQFFRVWNLKEGKVSRRPKVTYTTLNSKFRKAKATYSTCCPRWIICFVSPRIFETIKLAKCAKQRPLNFGWTYCGGGELWRWRPWRRHTLTEVCLF